MTSNQTSQTNTGTAKTDALWESFHAELYGFVRARVSSAALAQDVLQQAFLKAHAELTTGIELEQPRAWLFQVVRNLLHDVSRAAHRQRRIHEAASGDPDRDLESTAEQDVFSLVARLLPQLIAQLEEPYRTALQRTELEGMTQQQAAALEGVSLTCMKSRVRRAKRQVREALDRCCQFDVDGRGRIIDCKPYSASCKRDC